MSPSSSSAPPFAIIVGAGPVGLMTAVLLSRHGLSSLVIERRTSRHGAPKAHALNPRSLEICQAIGMDIDAMQRAATRPEDGGWVCFMTTLTGQEIGNLPYERQDDAVRDVTPLPLINLAQPKFEMFLEAMAARSALIRIERGIDWVGCRETGDGIVSDLRMRATDQISQQASRYLIGADGAGSAVRDVLGIAMEGEAQAQNFITIHFGANLRPLVATRPAILYWVMQPPHMGVLIAYDIENTWVLLYPYDDATRNKDSFTPEVCHAIIQDVIGSAEAEIEIKHVLPWRMNSEIATRYRQGSAFLVGDSAHRFPPTGGLGLNTGLQDAHNLVWKLAAVARGTADAALLDTYEVERRGVARTNAAQSLKNARRILSLQAALGTGDGAGGIVDAPAFLARLADPAAQTDIQAGIEAQREHFDSLALQLGFGYGPSRPEPDNISNFVPDADIGSRMPHSWIEIAGERASSLDLLNDLAFTLVAPAPIETDLLDGLGETVRVAVMGRHFADPSGKFATLTGLSSGHCLLIRPDGHIAAVFSKDATAADIGPDIRMMTRARVGVPA